MSLNDFTFIIIFIPLFVVMLVLQMLRKRIALIQKFQLAVLLIFSYFFICYFDYRFGICVAIMTAIAYFSGFMMQTYPDHKRVILLGGGIACIVILGYFKYCNFFIDSFARALRLNLATLDIILPLGISFYTFTALSYMIDVYLGKYVAEKNVLLFALFIAFFPKVTAGPIVRGNEFFPQARNYCGVKAKNIQEGIQIFVFGLFKKIVLADRLGVFVDDVFFAPSAYNTGTVLLAVISYSLQIYFDFSGYSDMALGVSKMLGFNFKPNFNLPYISENPSEFWKRWHISLSTWFQDYLYIPLGGNRKGNGRTYVNLLIVMIVSGLWHGAGWTFVIWGLLHGVASCVHKAWRGFGAKKIDGMLVRSCRVLLMFAITSLLWIVFRASDFANAITMLKSLFTIHTGISQPYTWSFFAIFVLIIATVVPCIKQTRQNKISGFYPILDLNKFWSWVLFFIFIGFTIMMGYFGNTAFIYGRF